MVITVLSCSKNEELFAPFKHCLEKYYPNHPEVVYLTDGIMNPYYETIAVVNEIGTWTKGFREFLHHIDDDYVLLMIDDCFIRKPVDEKRIRKAKLILDLEPNLACLNFEKAWDEDDEETIYHDWKKRKKGSRFEVSLMCGLWNKEKLLKVVDRDCSPWEIEENQDGKGFDYYINAEDYIIDWGYRTFKPSNVVKGKWARECQEFFEQEGIRVDYSKKGFID